jgi:hypothetical protein
LEWDAVYNWDVFTLCRDSYHYAVAVVRGLRWPTFLFRVEWFDVLVAVVKYRLPRLEESIVDMFLVLNIVMVRILIYT